MVIHNFDQHSEEWFAIRRGKFTASTFKDLFATKTTATYQNAIKKVAFERITGESPESYTNEYMARGTELEPFARKAYEDYTFTEVKEVGFYELNEWVGCSPDGIVGEGIIEIKCPSYATMLDYLCNPKLPNQYVHQVQGQLWITNAKWADFVAYHPKLPFMVLRIERDEKLIKELEEKLNSCIEEVKKIIETVNNYKNG